MRRRPLRPDPHARAVFAISALTDAERASFRELGRGRLGAPIPRVHAELFRARGWALLSLDSARQTTRIRITREGMRLARILEEMTR